MGFQYKRIIVKVGSNVITKDDGLPDSGRIKHLVNQLAAIKKEGVDVILVSSGAVASGRSLVSLKESRQPVAIRQVLSSVGQVQLIHTYSELFNIHDMLCAQVLVTKEDFRDRVHYLNMKNCLNSLLQHNIIPIVNENDVVSVTELMFTDNDELAGLIASMLNADALIILSNIDGIYDGDPKLATSRIIEQIQGNDYNFSSIIKPEKSTFGRGGMVTKTSIARKVSKLGIAVHIANGKRDEVLFDLLMGKLTHSYFVPEKRKSGKKKWIAHAESSANGIVKLNNGAKTVLTSGNVRSLLPIGILEIIGNFKKGDIIKILDEDNAIVGLGIAQYGADKARERLGLKNQKALVHYDYFYSIY
ncbi:glutamate 5-kinase [Olivibacter sp. SDN3]|uniref:glutamate 5-kinase n=1 Tax=Olivibacter sp. SDN3 TaxID=2764720 RepID=UPI001651495F|nr:glutamate 5-kinase [Olivibacter sp. SDN3]QNL48889.1 glutamate 5-kinase [Olivibacter sp. SDN3]